MEDKCKHQYEITGKCEWEGLNGEERKVTVEECTSCGDVLEKDI